MPIKSFLFLLSFVVTITTNAQNVKVWHLDDLTSAIHNSKAPTIITFWATFCKPCIGELPHFQALANQYKQQDLQLIMVSLDLKEAFPKKIASIAKKLKLTSKVVFLAETDADLFCPAVDSSWSGAIPATIFVNNATGYRKFIEDELNIDVFKKEITMMLTKKE